jgi:hypothetical protein
VSDIACDRDIATAGVEDCLSELTLSPLRQVARLLVGRPEKIARWRRRIQWMDAWAQYSHADERQSNHQHQDDKER